ncbi:hypothetical protein G7059_09605 [Erysipelothrix sp. HDW6A]|uniref:hypothetical protein n=1 Tax=Erysipelothrix sp. HDW6A TaxID=2714928 RepID=UPI00140BC682|nr:hypothetical protein [Erysipelothrix sp. HDW6A]QIK58083.1 hypothetical protein G7059_09605 [Erysipelothrix sp. HDW6A]
MKKKISGIVVLAAIFVIFAGITLSKGEIINPNSISCKVNEVSNKSVSIEISGSMNSSKKFTRYEHDYKEGILTLYFYDSIFFGDNYPQDIIIYEDFRELSTIKIADKDDSKIIYEN